MTKWPDSERLHANMEERIVVGEGSWWGWGFSQITPINQHGWRGISGSHVRPMKSLQMPRGHTSGQLCYVESEPLWMKLAITPNGFRSPQLSSIHSPQIWHERPCSHDRHMRTARLNQSASYPKG